MGRNASFPLGGGVGGCWGVLGGGGTFDLPSTGFLLVCLHRMEADQLTSHIISLLHSTNHSRRCNLKLTNHKCHNIHLK